MKRTFSTQPSLIPISKNDINDYFKTIWEDVWLIMDDFSTGLPRANNIVDVIIEFDRLKDKVNDYFSSLQLK